MPSRRRRDAIIALYALVTSIPLESNKSLLAMADTVGDLLRAVQGATAPASPLEPPEVRHTIPDVAAALPPRRWNGRRGAGVARAYSAPSPHHPLRYGRRDHL